MPETGTQFQPPTAEQLESKETSSPNSDGIHPIHPEYDHPFSGSLARHTRHTISVVFAIATSAACHSRDNSNLATTPARCAIGPYPELFDATQLRAEARQARVLLKPQADISTSLNIGYRIPVDSRKSHGSFKVAGTQASFVEIDVEHCQKCALRLQVARSGLALVAKQDSRLETPHQSAEIYIRAGTPVSVPDSREPTVNTAWGEATLSSQNVSDTYFASAAAQYTRRKTKRATEMYHQPCADPERPERLAIVPEGSTLYVVRRYGEFTRILFENDGIMLAGFIRRTDEPDEEQDESDENRPLSTSISYTDHLTLEKDVCLFAGLTGEVIGRVTARGQFASEPSRSAGMQSLFVSTELGAVEVFVQRDADGAWRRCPAS